MEDIEDLQIRTLNEMRISSKLKSSEIKSHSNIRSWRKNR